MDNDSISQLKDIVMKIFSLILKIASQLLNLNLEDVDLENIDLSKIDLSSLF